jgi:hypothetical protein
MDPVALLQLSRRLQQVEVRVNPAGHAKFAGRCQDHAATQGGVLDSSEIYGGSLSSGSVVDGVAAGLYAAHPKALAAREELPFVSSSYAAGDHRAGDHRAKAFDGEGAIDGEAEIVVGTFTRSLLGYGEQRLF